MENWDPMKDEYNGNSTPHSRKEHRLYIANIPMTMSKAEVQHLFKKYGKLLSCFVKLAAKEGRQYQYGIVMYASFDEANSAISGLNGVPPLKLKISFYKPRCDKSQLPDNADDSVYRGSESMTTDDSSGTRNVQDTTDDYNPRPKDDGYQSHLKGDLSNDESSNTIPCTTCSAATTEGCMRCWTPYCSVNCQKRDWSRHQKDCAQLAWRFESLQTARNEVVGTVSDRIKANSSNDHKIDVKPQATPQPKTASQVYPINESPKVWIADIYEIATWVKETFPSYTRVKVQIAHVNSPCSFYIQHVDQTKMLQIMAEMQQVKQDGPAVFKDAGFRCGLVFAAQYCEDGEALWYRARVEKILPNSTAEILFVDFGNKETVECSSLRAVPKHLEGVHHMAVHCTLLGFPESDVYPEVILQKFRSICCGEIWVENVGQDTGKLIVRLHNSSATGSCINDVLQQDLERSLPLWMKSLLELCTQCSSVSSTSVEATVDITNPKPPLTAQCPKPKTYTLETSKTHCLPVGEELKLTAIQVTSPEILFFWQAEKQAANLKALDNEIDKYCCNLQNFTDFKPNFGDLCLAQFSVTNKWYRGAVMVHGMEESQVLFVDYGNLESVHNSHIVPTIDRFMELPLQAVHCRIDGCYTDREWSESVLGKLIEIEDTFLARVVSFDANNCVYSIQIPCLTKQLKDLNILPPHY